MADNENAAKVNQGGEDEVDSKAEETKVVEAAKPAEATPDLEDFSKFEPEVRKRPIDYIEERRSSRTKAPVADHGTEVREDQADEEELSPKAQAFLSKQLADALNPIKNFVAEDWNKREIAEVISEKPEWARYKPLAEKYMKADGWQGVPAKRIFQMLDYEHSGERGAEYEREKAAKANRAKGGSSFSSARARASQSAEVSAEDIAKLSPAAYTELQKRLAMGEELRTQ